MNVIVGRHSLACLVVGLGLVCLAQVASAATGINEQIPFYGTLKNSSGDTLDGTYDMVFRLYDAPTGGTLLDTSTHTAGNGNAVTVTDGDFGVLLGSGAGNALDGVDFNDDTIYVGVSIEGDAEMTPRERLGAVAYTFNADQVDGYHANQLLRYNATGSISTSSADTLLTITQNGTGDIFNVFDGGTEVFSIIDGGNVGVGTTSPLHDFSVSGDAIITGRLYDNTNSAGTNGMVLQSTGVGFQWVATSTLGLGGGGGSSLFTDGGVTTYLSSTTDNLAIGTTTGTSRLNILGGIDLLGNAAGILIDGVSYFRASTTNENIMIGENAGDGFATAETDNVAIGYLAGQNASTTFNSFGYFIGTQAGQNNNGDGNVLIGYQTGRNNNGDAVTSMGYQAGESSLGGYNFYGGYQTGRENDGNYNAAVGYQAGYQAFGSINAFIGATAGASSTGDTNVFLGYEAGYENNGDQNVILGRLTGYSNASDYSVLIGQSAGRFNAADSAVIIGFGAGVNNEGTEVVLLGKDAGVNNKAASAILIGTDAGQNQEGSAPIFIGTLAGEESGGVFNIGIGSSAGRYASGTLNTYIGILAGANNDGDHNNFIGYQAGENGDGSRTTFAGYRAGQYASATDTVAIGSEALRGYNDIGLGMVRATVNNTALGAGAGRNIRDGADGNIFIGYEAAGSSTITGDRNIIIGNDIELLADGSNGLNVGNLLFGTGLSATGTATSTGNIGIGTTTPTEKLTVIGTVRSSDLLGGATSLSTDAKGNIIRTPSDRNLKTNIESIDNALEKVLQLEGVTFDWIDESRFGDQTEMGFIAQDVELILPEVVRNGGNYVSLNTPNILAVVVEAIKDMWSEFESYMVRVERLEEQNAALLERVETLEAELDVEPPADPEPETEPDPAEDDSEVDPIADNDDEENDESASSTASQITEEENDEADDGGVVDGSTASDDETESEESEEPETVESEDDNELPEVVEAESTEEIES